MDRGGGWSWKQEVEGDTSEAQKIYNHRSVE